LASLIYCSNHSNLYILLHIVSKPMEKMPQAEKSKGNPEKGFSGEL